MKSITVYCSSSTRIDPAHHEAARRVGDRMAREDITLVYGGGRIGLMGEVGRAVRAGGGRTEGIITSFLLSKEQGDQDCDELIVVETMQQRRRILMDRGEGYLVLPGGLGTYEEFFEVLVQRQLGELGGPIALVNVNGYFDALHVMLEQGIEQGFIRAAVRELLYFDSCPDAAIDHLMQAPAISGGHDRFLPSGSE
jgi:uncharacterized protein (TIGR00730 family)